jgi:hypothetical protein
MSDHSEMKLRVVSCEKMTPLGRAVVPLVKTMTAGDAGSAGRRNGRGAAVRKSATPSRSASSKSPPREATSFMRSRRSASARTSLGAVSDTR